MRLSDQLVNVWPVIADKKDTYCVCAGGGGDLYFLKWLIEMTTIMMTLSRQVQNGEYPDRTLLRKWWNNLNMKKKKCFKYN